MAAFPLWLAGPSHRGKSPGGGGSYMEQMGMLVGNFFLKETIWVWHKQILTPKRDRLKKKKKKKKENLTSVSLRVILCFFTDQP